MAPDFVLLRIELNVRTYQPEGIVAKSYNQKTKLLHILRILREKTDENHYLTAAGLIAELDKEGIRAERKSIYSDIEELIEYGYDIIHVKSRTNGGYYLGSREFELAELKLLVDAVQASKFITKKKSEELIKKLEKLTSIHEARSLQRQVYVTNRIKTDNESIYYNVDDIHNAILSNKKVKFQYMEWSVTKELKPRKNGEWYEVSPYALIWAEERYYLVGYSGIDEEIRHYRVDKIGKLEILNEKREGMDNPGTFDVATYSNKMFGMYGGMVESVTIGFPLKMTGVFIDRFGKEIDIRKREEEYLSVRVSVVLSGQFFGWLAGLGNEVKIMGPSEVQQKYCNYLEEILNNNRQV